MRRQLDQFRAAGLDGVVFHPRFYAGNPPYLGAPYFDYVSEAILHARSIGLTFWLYDENGWPSGSVGGQLLRQFPGYGQRWVGLFRHGTDGCLLEFEHDGRTWCLAERQGGGIDYLAPGPCKQFIEMTYEAYRRGLSPEAFAHVEAFFSDEPEFGLGHVWDVLPPDGAIPWTPGLPQLYRERYGDELMPLLPALFFRIDGCEEVRIRFHQLLSDLFCEGFISPLDDWCRAHGKRFTAHVKGEEHPLFQVPMVGSCHPIFRRLSLPGIDALERHPSNDFYPRQVSSAARQFGDGRCMVEAFGGAGWGATPEELERYLVWLGGHGLTDFVMHLSQYRLDSAAIRDWPPSQPLHLSWSAVYPHVLDRVRAAWQAHPRPAADTLVVAPYRGIMGVYEPWELMQMNIHDAGTHADTDAGRINDCFLKLIGTLHHAGVAYDMTDERTMEQFAARSGESVKLGNCLYERVIVADGCRIEARTLALADDFKASAEATLPAENPLTGSPSATTGGASIPIGWRLKAQPINSMLLETMSDDQRWHTTEFASEAPVSNALETRLIFADDIAEVLLNGNTLSIEALDDGTAAAVPWENLRPANVVRFQTRHAVKRPFVWLEGPFRVASHTPFTDGPGGAVRTEGPFAIRHGSDILEQDLVANGFPFLRESLVAVAEINFPRPATAVRLEEVDACAVRLWVDDRDLGWIWRTDGTYSITAALRAGVHTIQIELLPNSYNVFGPHHYYNGDWFVVSPDQMIGVRNFADAPGAPQFTHVPTWHFRPFSLPSSLTLFE